MKNEEAIEKELRRSTPANTQRIFMDITQVLLDSENFYELPIVERSNMFNELRNVADFKNTLNDSGTKGHQPDQGLPGLSRIQGDSVQDEPGH